MDYVGYAFHCGSFTHCSGTCSFLHSFFSWINFCVCLFCVFFVVCVAMVEYVYSLWMFYSGLVLVHCSVFVFLCWLLFVLLLWGMIIQCGFFLRTILVLFHLVFISCVVCCLFVSLLWNTVIHCGCFTHCFCTCSFIHLFFSAFIWCINCYLYRVLFVRFLRVICPFDLFFWNAGVKVFRSCWKKKCI